MTIEGEIRVSVSTAAGRVTRAQARPERPRVAGRLFAGRSAAEAPRLAGAIFAICGRSQAVGSETAIEAARAAKASPEIRAARAARIAAETIQEHAFRLLVDWPRLAGRMPDLQALARAREVLAPLLDAREDADIARARSAAAAWGGDAVFGRSPAAFLELESLDAFMAWAASAATSVAALASHCLARYAELGSTAVAALPSGDNRWVSTLAPAIDAEEDFDQAPHCEGEARETGPLSRNGGHPLVAASVAAWGRGVGARFVARLVDLAAVLDSFGRRHGASALSKGSAIAWVETARGLLVHRVLLDGERIARYRIVAPTEWNFHPAGAFAKGALALAGEDAARLEREVRWLVASLDPCVAVRYEASHA